MRQVYKVIQLYRTLKIFSRKIEIKYFLGTCKLPLSRTEVTRSLIQYTSCVKNLDFSSIKNRRYIILNMLGESSLQFNVLQFNTSVVL